MLILTRNEMPLVTSIKINISLNTCFSLGFAVGECKLILLAHTAKAKIPYHVNSEHATSIMEVYYSFLWTYFQTIHSDSVV